MATIKTQMDARTVEALAVLNPLDGMDVLHVSQMDHDDWTARLDAITAETVDAYRDAGDDTERWQAMRVGFSRLPSEDTANRVQRAAGQVLDARMTLLRWAVPVGDRLGMTVAAMILDLNGATDTESIEVTGSDRAQVSQVRRGIKRTATYDDLAIPSSDRWSIRKVERASEDDWQAHLSAILATPEQDDNTTTEDDDDTATADAMASTVSPADRAMAALDALASVLPDLDDDDRVRVAARMASLMSSGE